MIRLFTCLRVGELAVSLVALLDLVEQGFLGLGIVGTKQECTLEHEVLQVVSQTGSFGGVILRPRTHGYISLNTRLLSIY